MLTIGHLSARPSKRNARLTYDSVQSRITESSWYIRRPKLAPNPRRCPYEWKTSEPVNNRLPRHITQAVCDPGKCDNECLPLVYYLPVRIDPKDGGQKYWTYERVNVSFVFKFHETKHKSSIE